MDKILSNFDHHEISRYVTTSNPENCSITDSTMNILPQKSPLLLPHLLPNNLPSTVARKQISPQTNAFRQKYFSGVNLHQWNDWRWQLTNRIRNLDTLGKIIVLSKDERELLENKDGNLPVGITPFYASIIDPDDPTDPIRRSVIPISCERVVGPGESDDPLGEDSDSPVPGLIQRYPDRVLFLVTDFCSVYCRYCTRSRIVGGGRLKFSTSQWETALQYIAATPTIRDVLISGGDPMTLSDERLNYLLSRLRDIPHVELIRIGTKVPIVLPQRITYLLVRMLRHHHPLWMSLNFMHPKELTPEVSQACSRLADAGIPLGSQTVLMSGINDNVDTLRSLFHGLLKFRVRPYYLYQCDPIRGTAHFRTSVEKGLEIIHGLRGYTTGYAVPSYVIDAPGGGGKIQLLPNAVIKRDAKGWILRNYEGQQFFYPDPIADGVPSCDNGHKFLS